MYKNLYESFKHWYQNMPAQDNSIWFYSDPHFSDEEMKYIRKDYIGDEEQVKRINSKVGKNDTLIILGDIGNIDWVKKLRANRKILIMGNHDTGASKYERIIRNDSFPFHIDPQELKKIEDSYPGFDGPGDWYAMCEEQNNYTDSVILKDFIENHRSQDNLLIHVKRNNRDRILTTHNDKEDQWYYHCQYDNHLFDEIYEGTLQISPKIILSHEPVEYKYCLNIHGHDHSNWYKGENHLNVCAEHINYYPVNLNEIIKSGKLKDIPDIHRETIDKASNK